MREMRESMYCAKISMFTVIVLYGSRLERYLIIQGGIELHKVAVSTIYILNRFLY